MAKKVYRQNLYLVVQDTISGVVEVSKTAVNMYIEPEAFDSDIFLFHLTKNLLRDGKDPAFKKYNINDLQKKDGTPYTKTTFIEFYTLNTGPPFSAGALDVIDVDDAGRKSVNTVFGEDLVGTRVPSIAAQFHYGLQDGDANVVTVGSGTVSFDESRLKLSTGTDSTGYAEIISTSFLRYLPGHEAYFKYTWAYNTPTADSRQKGGIWDGDNGFYVGYEGLDFVLGRSRDGVPTEIIIDPSEVFLDVGDGITEAFHPENGNVYRITYGYLGYAPITYEVMSPSGAWTFLGRFTYPNSSKQTHITNPNLPIRAIIENFGNTTDIIGFGGSVEAGIVYGGGEDVTARHFNFGLLAPKAVTSGSTTIMTFRNTTIFNGVENRVPARLLLVTGANDSNKIVRWNLYKNPTFTVDPAYTDVSTGNSTLEVDQATAVVDTTLSNDTFLSWNTAKSSDFFDNVESFVLDLPPGGEASFVILTAGTGDVDLSIRWKELF